MEKQQNPAKIHYLHIRRHLDGVLQPSGGITLAVIKDSERAFVQITHARCSKKDVFCKKTGRSISYVRMESAKARHIMLTCSEFASFMKRVCSRYHAPYPEKGVDFVLKNKPVSDMQISMKLE